MKQQEAIKVFEDKKVRTFWDNDREKWYFSIIDVIEVLTNSPNPQVYWRVMKKRLKDEGSETVTNCNGLKMKAIDGKMKRADLGLGVPRCGI
jgi:hypothetical protein